MEIYSSSAEQARTTADTPIYRSRTRLLVGAFVWMLAAIFFGALSWKVQGKTGQLVFCLFIFVGNVLLALRCLKYAVDTTAPALIFTRAGLQRDNGTLITWDSIVANNYVNNTYFGIPFSKQIQLQVGQPPKPVLISATALQLSGDEYAALCDRYRAAA